MRSRKLLTLVSCTILFSAGAQTLATAAEAVKPVLGGAGASAIQSAAGPTISADYQLGFGDILDIGLVGRKDFDARVRVSADGTILLPLIGAIQAVDRTPNELAGLVRKALIGGGYFSDPLVRAEVVGISSRYVTVMGAVGSPGLVTLDRNYRLSEILARVGGRSVGGAEFVLLTRASGGPAEKVFLESLGTLGAEHDPMIAAGDKVYVPPADAEVYYISGQVHSPGTFPVTRRVTFRTAIAKAGGMLQTGSERRVTVIRGGRKLTRVDLDALVQMDDIITVGERLF